MQHINFFWRDGLKLLTVIREFHNSYLYMSLSGMHITGTDV
jgi:hypothetical protein